MHMQVRKSEKWVCGWKERERTKWKKNERLGCFSPSLEASIMKVPLMKIHVDCIEQLMVTRGEDELERKRSLLVLGVWEKEGRSELLIFVCSLRLAHYIEKWKWIGVFGENEGGLGEWKMRVETWFYHLISN
jgi:hypothetical protein